MGHAVPKGHRPQLDGLRAIAVGLVMVSHWWHGYDSSVYPLGVMGVGIFFVLSGYLITGILLDARDRYEPLGHGSAHTFRAFYARRAVRIFPAYYLFLLVMALDPDGPVRSGFAWYATYLGNVHISAQSSWPGNASHLWSLAVEEQFYLVWPVVVLLTPRRLLTQVALGAVALTTFTRFAAPGSSLLPPTTFQGLVVGSALMVVLRTRPDLLRHPLRLVALPTAGVVLLSAEMASAPSFTVDAVRVTLLYVVFAGIVLTAARGIAGPVGAVLTWSPVQYLGRISYGLYLWHLAPDQLVEMVTGESVALHPGWKLVITIAVASASFHAIERPINGLKDRWRYVAEDTTPAGEAAPSDEASDETSPIGTVRPAPNGRSSRRQAGTPGAVEPSRSR